MEYHSANNSIVVQFRLKENTYRKEKINCRKAIKLPLHLDQQLPAVYHHTIGLLPHRQLHFVFFWKEATWRIWTKTFSSRTQLPLSDLTQGQKQSRVYRKHKQSISTASSGGYRTRTLQRAEFESSAQHRALKGGKGCALSWCARIGKRLYFL